MLIFYPHRPALNCMFAGDGMGLFRFAVVTWSGSTHDARVYGLSHLKDFIEGQTNTSFMITGDSGYPLSKVNDKK